MKTVILFPENCTITSTPTKKIRVSLYLKWSGFICTYLISYYTLSYLIKSILQLEGVNGVQILRQSDHRQFILQNPYQKIKATTELALEGLSRHRKKQLLPNRKINPRTWMRYWIHLSDSRTMLKIWRNLDYLLHHLSKLVIKHIRYFLYFLG